MTTKNRGLEGYENNEQHVISVKAKSCCAAMYDEVSVCFHEKQCLCSQLKEGSVELPHLLNTLPQSVLLLRAMSIKSNVVSVVLIQIRYQTQIRSMS